jgi:hypothetical protein
MVFLGLVTTVKHSCRPRLSTGEQVFRVVLGRDTSGDTPVASAVDVGLRGVHERPAERPQEFEDRSGAVVAGEPGTCLHGGADDGGEEGAGSVHELSIPSLACGFSRHPYVDIGQTEVRSHFRGDRVCRGRTVPPAAVVGGQGMGTTRRVVLPGLWSNSRAEGESGWRS